MRQALFNIVQTSIDNSSFLDLFAGSGIMGIEAISRGADHATFIDHNQTAIQVIKENLKKLNVEKFGATMQMDVNKGLKKLKQTFSIAYLDPPYQLASNYIATTFSNLTSVMEDNGHIFLERKAHEEEIFQIEGIHYVSARKFGNSVLYQYIVS